MIAAAPKTGRLYCDGLLWVRAEERTCDKLLGEIKDGKLWLKCPRCHCLHAIELTRFTFSE